MIAVYTRHALNNHLMETERVVVKPRMFIGYAVIETLEDLPEAATLLAVIDAWPLTIQQRTEALVAFMGVLPVGMIHARVIDTFVTALNEIDSAARCDITDAEAPQDPTIESTSVH
jgi:hypothetical protein